MPTIIGIDWAEKPEPEPQVDWSKAPEGATHYSPETDAKHAVFYKDDFKQMWIEQWPNLGWQEAHSLNEHERPIFIPQKLESIRDVARSIEAARVAEQSERNYPHYFKDVSAVDAIDLYHVARLYDITDPALFHAFKKIACAGKRGTKDRAQDVQEAIDALKRWQELSV